MSVTKMLTVGVLQRLFVDCYRQVHSLKVLSSIVHESKAVQREYAGITV